MRYCMLNIISVGIRLIVFIWTLSILWFNIFYDSITNYLLIVTGTGANGEIVFRKCVHWS